MSSAALVRIHHIRTTNSPSPCAHPFTLFPPPLSTRFTLFTLFAPSILSPPMHHPHRTGCTHLLTRMPGLTGMYAALTGHTLGMGDLLYTGLATHAVSLDEVAPLQQVCG